MTPLVVAIRMGYGHLRAAAPLAEALGVGVLHADRAPLADRAEQRRWAAVRFVHEALSRASGLPVVGRPFGAAMDALTAIPPLATGRELEAPTWAVRYLDRQARAGAGHGLVERLRETGSPLLTTFYAPVVIADRAGCENVFCVVTDADVNRVWVQADTDRSRAIYFAPSARVKRRLETYGVRPENAVLTGFPLPLELLGGPELPAARSNLAHRLARLDLAGAFRGRHREEIERAIRASAPNDDRPPLVTFAVGGAGAQTRLARRFLPALRAPIEAERIRLALVAGVRPEVHAKLGSWVRDAGLEDRVSILFEPDLDAYFRRFDALMAETDVLWTKPSEVTFFAALGIPLVLSSPVGAQEVANRAWAMEHGAAIDQGDPSRAGEWLPRWATDGTLAAAAWAGFRRLPADGTYRIVETLRESSAV